MKKNCAELIIRTCVLYMGTKLFESIGQKEFESSRKMIKSSQNTWPNLLIDQAMETDNSEAKHLYMKWMGQHTYVRSNKMQRMDNFINYKLVSKQQMVLQVHSKWIGKFMYLEVPTEIQ